MASSTVMHGRTCVHLFLISMEKFILWELWQYYRKEYTHIPQALFEALLLSWLPNVLLKFLESIKIDGNHKITKLTVTGLCDIDFCYVSLKIEFDLLSYSVNTERNNETDWHGQNQSMRYSGLVHRWRKLRQRNYSIWNYSLMKD